MAVGSGPKNRLPKMQARLGVDEHGDFTWYHTFDFPSGVTTDGIWDLRGMVDKLPIPSDLSGQDCLDVAGADGFWAFELYRRHAARVVSTDLDDHAAMDWQGVSHLNDEPFPKPGRAMRAFMVARKELGMEAVERIDISAYDLAPDNVGTFDFAFIGNILIHLSDPARALRRVRSVLKDDGRILSLEPVSLPLSMLTRKIPLGHLFGDDAPRWWTPNRAAHRRLLEAAGFRIIDSGFPIMEKMGKWRARVPRELPRDRNTWHFWLWARQFGITTGWVLAEPAALPS